MSLPGPSDFEKSLFTAFTALLLRRKYLLWRCALACERLRCSHEASRPFLAASFDPNQGQPVLGIRGCVLCVSETRNLPTLASHLCHTTRNASPSLR